MLNISKVSFCSQFDNTKNYNKQNLKSDYYQEDTIELASTFPKKTGVLSKIKEFFSPSNMHNISNNKIQDINEIEQIKNNAKTFYSDADCILQSLNTENYDPNIINYSIYYKNTKYTAIATITPSGLVDKIIHVVNGKISTIYDIKTSIEAGEGRKLFNDDNKREICADCYFYNKNDNDDYTMNVKYVQDIKNDAQSFHAVYDTRYGGEKRVTENKDFSPYKFYTFKTIDLN